MVLAPAPVWQQHYPPGVRADVELPVFPVHDIVSVAAQRWGDKTAIEFNGLAISYDRLAELIDRSAAAFVALGVKPGDCVALLLPNTPWHPVAFFGALSAGATVVHISPLDVPRVVEHKLRDSGARVLVTSDADGIFERALTALPDGLVERVVVGEAGFWESDNSSSFASSAGGLPPPRTPPLKGEGGVNGPESPSPLRGGVRGGGKASEEEKSAGRIIHWPENWPSTQSTTPLPAPALDDLALLQYTGGTTGLPKAAMLTHRNLSAAVSAYDLWYTGRSEDGAEIILLYLPLFHIYGLSTVLLRCLRAGHTLLLRNRFDAVAALDEIERGVTVFPGVPTMWIAMAQVPDFETRNFSSLRIAASGGAPMPAEVARRIQARSGLELLGGWGMSETAPAGTNLPPGYPAKKYGSIGIPIPGVDLRIVALDDPRRVLGINETGELAIRGANVTKGYLNRPDDNAQSYVDGWFLTGDIGYMDEDGYFFIVDRKKDMIISGGFNVYPQMIEQAIYEHPDGAGSARHRYTGRLSRRGGEGLCAAATWCANAYA
jgi:long-chain acyl-CoA synthetase